MYELILENKQGARLTFGMGSPFSIIEIQGLAPPSAIINTSGMALVDGAKYNSSKLDMRTINIAFAIEYSAAANRLEVYKVLKSKDWIRVYYHSDYRDVYIDGYNESIDITHFARKQVVTCSILCPSPYFRSAQSLASEMSGITGGFMFPFASTAAPEIVFGYLDPTNATQVDNAGEIETGMIIELYARGSLGAPKVFDCITNDYIGVNYTMRAGDLITIDTRQGEKTITLTRNAVESNIFNSLMNGSTWLQLGAAGGMYAYEVGSGSASDLVITIKHDALFEGV